MITISAAAAEACANRALAMAMDTARLRKAFRYPGDDDGTGLAAEEMDEEGKLSFAFSSVEFSTS